MQAFRGPAEVQFLSEDQKDLDLSNVHTQQRPLVLTQQVDPGDRVAGGDRRTGAGCSLAIIDPPVGGADMVRRLHEAEDCRTTAPAALLAAVIQDTPSGFPWLVIAGKTLAGWLVIDMDATLTTAYGPDLRLIQVPDAGFLSLPRSVRCSRRVTHVKERLLIVRWRLDHSGGSNA